MIIFGNIPFHYLPGTYEYKFSTDNWSNSEILTSIINDGCVVSNQVILIEFLNLTMIQF